MTSTSGLYSLLKVGALTFFGAFFAALTFTKVPDSAAEWKALVFPCLATAIAAEVYFLRTQIAALVAQLTAQLPPVPPVTTTKVTTVGPGAVSEVTTVGPTASPAAADRPNLRGFATLRVLGALAVVAILATFALHGRTRPPCVDPVEQLELSEALVNVPVEGCSGGISPNEQQAIVASEALGACVENVFATDSEKQTPALQIALDAADACGADVGDLVASLLNGAASSSGQARAPAPGAPSRADVVSAAQGNAGVVHAHALAHRQNAAAAAAARP